MAFSCDWSKNKSENLRLQPKKLRIPVKTGKDNRIRILIGIIILRNNITNRFFYYLKIVSLTYSYLLKVYGFQK